MPHNEFVIETVYGNEKFFRSFYEALSQVARERVYLEMLSPPPFDDVVQYQKGLISRNGPVFYAVEGDRVVGWVDIFPDDNPRLSHRGTLGMGVLREYRGQGIGERLLTAALAKAAEFGLEKVELNVYTSNIGAIALYRKMGFQQEGLIKKYRKLDGRYFDSLVMAVDLTVASARKV